MKKKICPFCDRAMKHSCYCSFCRRLVLHPKEQEIDYYLNERHPQHEEDCTYHGSLPGERVAGNRPSPSPTPVRSPKPANAKGRKKWNAIKSVLMLYIILMVMGGLGKFRESFRPTRTPEPENIAADLAVSVSPDDADYGLETEHDSWERTDEQVREAGVACNAYGHLPVKFEAMSSAITSQLTAADYLVSPWSQWSFNQDLESYTSFNTYYDCAVLKKDEDCGDLSLFYDTATGEFHGLVLYSEDQEEIRRISEKVIEAFRSLKIISEETDAEQILNDLFENAQADATVLLETGSLEITFRTYSYGEYEDYGISFYAAGYFTDPS